MKKNEILNLFLLTAVIGLVISCGGSDNDDTTPSSSSSGSASPAAASCPLVSNAAGASVVSGTDTSGNLTCTYTGTYNDSFQMKASATHILSGPVKIGDDTTSPTLTIDAGTTLRGESGKDSLNILRGAKILAKGTATNPIIMTSASDDGTLAADAQAQWGGLQIMGKATQNCTEAEKNADGICERSAEGFDAGAVKYGGNDDNDNSGELSYVVVKYAGYAFTSENELNGIAFYAVGDATKVNYIRVHNNKDDGIEFFGGTVNFKYAYLTGNQDDSFDYTNGWRGNAQWVIIDQNTPDPATASNNRPDNGMEFDSNGKANDATPRSNPTISNFLIIGNTEKHGELVHLRAGTSATLVNGIIVDKSDLGPCIEIDDAATFNAAGSTSSTTLRAASVMIDCGSNKYSGESGDDGFSTAAWATAQGITEGTNSLNGYKNGATEASVTVNTALLGSFFDVPTEIGAVPSTGSDWTAVWSDL
ncbi:hypothetical protein N9V57_00210 [SAR86 cluster bacterium]|nr:hypothetical protein [SAR86 cluster bacterium]MEC7197399.1 hypothetical protein [Pseudomonadota bacterium]MEC7465331.1 hypothetical protein [Pseudomonadota bacterium]MEC8146617.1 hypothetical protein [Pseudomonadota bacterium]MEC8169055.1 hypothetical protein [Pseudomonadota bacterium]|tara:strand:- start:955 stop:2385 length:1431 start_codon:yes stop_codon:yes gene_type:complete